MLRRMAAYREFARFYDAVSIDRPVNIRAEFLQSLIEKYFPTARSVLEFASGTGTILDGLSQKYDVSGVDLSLEMVELAKQKLPDVDIRVGDVAKFDFGKKFDAVLCVYDSINHLPDWDSWCATFANAHRHLNPGGLFIFDMNTIERLEWLASFPPWGRALGGNYMITDVTKVDEVFDWDIKIFEKEPDGRFRLHRINVHEKTFPMQQVLDEAGKSFRVREIVGTAGLEKDNPNWRPSVVCQVP